MYVSKWCWNFKNLKSEEISLHQLVLTGHRGAELAWIKQNKFTLNALKFKDDALKNIQNLTDTTSFIKNSRNFIDESNRRRTFKSQRKE